MTNSVPCSAVSVSTADSTGSRPGASVPPRLRFTTVAFFSAAAHCMPARTADSEQ
jgi:hypothetical protein